MAAYCPRCQSEDCRCGSANVIALRGMPDAPSHDGSDEDSAFTPPAAAAHLHTPPAIAHDQDILATFGSALRGCGVVGEERNAKLTYLALTSRLLDEPVSLAVKGVSSSGKSYTVETTLKFFPESAFIEMTAMSERALVYMKEDFAHRAIVLFEAVALREQREKAESNLTAYFVRSLLSEGRINYPVVVRDKDGNFKTKTIIKNGPTNLILTTTATSLHGENETRLLSLPTNDTNEQTAAILLQLANGVPTEVDFGPWHRMQEWLATDAEHRVTIPYARDLAAQVPPVAVRLRRDFRAILRLIETHAILHQQTRERDDAGRIVATEADYVAIRTLVADLIADAIGATVPPTIRETVECVSALAKRNADGFVVGCTVRKVAAKLKLDRSAAQRRLRTAREHGYVTNEETRRGHPARYVIGEPLPDEVEFLPVRPVQTPCHTALDDKGPGQEGVCSSAASAEGVAGEDPDPLHGWSFAEPEPCIVCGSDCNARDPEGRVRHPACPVEGEVSSATGDDEDEDR